jgi:hypothetical protein
MDHLFERIGFVLSMAETVPPPDAADEQRVA